jgi:hypothetical protein
MNLRTSEALPYLKGKDFGNTIADKFPKSSGKPYRLTTRIFCSA